MKKLTICISLLVILAGNAPASVIFSDDFNIDGLDTSKWTSDVDLGCSLTVGGGILQNYFTGANDPRGSYAQSVNITLPANWTSIKITGQWAFPVEVTGEMTMSVENADAPENYDFVAYYVWNGPGFRLQDSTQGFYYYGYRTIPVSLTDFEWTITQTGLQFKEHNSDNTWTTLADYTTTTLAGMSHMFLKIGGWEYSYTSPQETNYDNIVVSVVPEPVTICLMAFGSLVFIGKKK